MTGGFYIEGKKEKLDISEIVNIVNEMKSIVSEVKTDITQIQTDITHVQNDVSQVIVSSGKQLLSMDFWSETVDEADVEIDAAGETRELPPVMVEKIPAGASVLRAVAMFKFRMLENTNTDPNRLNGGTVPFTSQVIQVRVDTPGEWGDAINFVDSQYAIEGETREGGDVCFGAVDISNIVVGNGVYDFRWLLARPLLDYMLFCDVQTGIRVWYKVPAS